MKLPNAERAVLNIEKLRDYCLNPDHPKGKHKAHVFQEKLGLKAEHAERLREQILEAALRSEAIEQTPSTYGRRFVIDFQGQRGVGYVMTRVIIRTAWIIRNDEDFARLTLCYIL
jgi:hypothetical protein